MDDDDELNYILKEVGHDLELEGKRYLIVLDDARQLPRDRDRDRDRESLILNHCLPKGRSGGAGGAVIVTSRRENVVTHMFAHAKPLLIRLEPAHLSDDVCWKIFSEQVQLLEKKMDPNHLLSTIQDDVKTKSKGQPLAAKTLANILPDLLSKSYWIPARDLRINGGDDDKYWKWTSLPPPEENEEVAELVSMLRLEMTGSLDQLKLNEMVFKTYSAYLVFKLKKECILDGLTARVRIVSDGKDAEGVQELDRRVLIYKENIQGTGWMEIKLGEFSIGHHGRLVEVIIEDTGTDQKSGLIVKGIDFRPNSIDSNVPTSMLRK